MRTAPRHIRCSEGTAPCRNLGNGTEQPRSRGDDPVGGDDSRAVMGTAPLTRGRRPGPTVVRVAGRNCPANAGTTRWRTHRAPRPQEQPRSRGDDVSTIATWQRATGTAPLTRGRLRREHRTRQLPRNSPAHAGTTSSIRRCRSPRPEQPRSRGEDCRFCSVRTSCAGTAPLTRGRRGLIPPVGHRQGEQPRSRGDDARGGDGTVCDDGTAPLTRGRLGVGAGELAHPGNSPAHAGTTTGRPGPGRWGREQPRSRGDDSRKVSVTGVSWGTAPLTRGRQPVAEFPLGPRGNSPAHAGTTCARPCARTEAREQPRSRGDDDVALEVDAHGRGTAQLTRGRLTTICVNRLLQRNSPAHAGTTTPRNRRASAAREQPRSRGDDDDPTNATPLPAGTAPLTRGRPRPGRRPGASDRNSPAHAGTTPARTSPAGGLREQPRSRGDDAASTARYSYM